MEKTHGQKAVVIKSPGGAACVVLERAMRPWHWAWKEGVKPGDKYYPRSYPVPEEEEGQALL